MTIRRDLKGLEREGSARLVRGGAIFVGTEEIEIRQSRALSAKRRIAGKPGCSCSSTIPWRSTPPRHCSDSPRICPPSII